MTERNRQTGSVSHPGTSAIVENPHPLADGKALLRIDFLHDGKATAFIHTDRDLETLATGHRLAGVRASDPAQRSATDRGRILTRTTSHLIAEETTSHRTEDRSTRAVPFKRHIPDGRDLAHPDRLGRSRLTP